jgi:hypothetical protein
MDGDGGIAAIGELVSATVFISRAGADAAFAAAIGTILEDAGHTVVLQQWDFGHCNFMEQMQSALAECDLVIALLSSEYLKSDHCLAEAFAVLAHDPLNKKGRLLVARVAECTPPGLLAALAYCDLVQVRDNLPMLRDIVLAAIRPGRQKNAISGPYWREARTIVHCDIHAVPNFTGRLPELAALDAALWTGGGGGGTVAITQAAVQGLGGVGKSVLAVQYAWANRARYAGVWRLIAETRSQILDGLIELRAQFISDPALEQDREAAARKALRFIEEAGFDKPWLLIYDNVDTPAVLNGLTPTDGAQVLITTRWPDWTGRAAPVPLGVFTPEEAMAFFTQRTGRADAAAAARLAEALGRLPVALDHAAAFCVETGDSFDDYGKRLAEWIKLAPEAADYPRTVFATFSLAMEQAAAKCPEAETLMGLLAWMAPDAIPRDIVADYAMNAMTLRLAVGALARVSLVTVAVSGPLLGVHRLVQLVMRGRLAERGKADDAAAMALRLVANAFSHLGGWRLFPHALAVLETPPKTADMVRDAAQLASQAFLYLHAHAHAHADSGSGNFVELQRFLLRRGADINAFDKGGMTPLHHVVAHWRRDYLDETTFWSAKKNTKWCYYWEQNIIFLVDNGANINAIDRENNTILSMCLINLESMYFTPKAAVEQIQFLLNIFEEHNTVPIENTAGASILAIKKVVECWTGESSFKVGMATRTVTIGEFCRWAILYEIAVGKDLYVHTTACIEQELENAVNELMETSKGCNIRICVSTYGFWRGWYDSLRRLLEMYKREVSMPEQYYCATRYMWLARSTGLGWLRLERLDEFLANTCFVFPTLLLYGALCSIKIDESNLKLRVPWVSGLFGSRLATTAHLLHLILTAQQLRIDGLTDIPLKRLLFGSGILSDPPPTPSGELLSVCIPKKGLRDLMKEQQDLLTKAVIRIEANGVFEGLFRNRNST